MFKHVRLFLVAIAICAVAAITPSLSGGEPPSSTRSKKAARPAPPKALSEDLNRLDLFVGPWRVTERHFNAIGDEIAVVKGTEEIVWLLNHHAIRRVYTTTSESVVFRAIGTLTFNEVAKEYQGIWFDNQSTAGPTTVKGEWSQETRTMVLTLESQAKNGKTIRHKVIERFLDDKRREAVTYLLHNDKVIKRTEVQYERTIPCPDRLRPILDELTRN